MRSAGRDFEHYVQWDVANWSRALAFWRQTLGTSGFAGAQALEIGSRDGGLSMWLADQGVAAVICSDLEGPTQLARETHARHGMEALIEYASIDAMNIGIVNRYDLVVFKSVLGGIGGAHGLEGQQLAIDSMHAALRPGGHLLLAENLQASPLHAYLRARHVKWNEHWRYLEQSEVPVLLHRFSRIQARTFGFAGTLGRTERQRAALARLDLAGLERVIPSDWHYIVACVATK